MLPKYVTNSVDDIDPIPDDHDIDLIPDVHHVFKS